MASKTPWIVVHDGSKPGRGSMELECLRCHERYEPTLPIPVDMWLALANTFIKTHQRCRPAAPPETHHDLTRPIWTPDDEAG